MTRIYYFSAAGHSRAVAQYMARMLGAPLYEIGREPVLPADTAVIVFPVYCQNIPAPVKAFLPSILAENAALIATYGKMGYGDVLREAAELVKGRVIAGAYVPTGHTYLGEGISSDYGNLQPLIDRIRAPRPVTIPHRRKWWLAGVFPGLRSRWGVGLKKTGTCTECGLCSRNCPMNTMKNGKPGRACIRCLRCATQCPMQGICVSYHPLLRFYLRKTRQEELVLYL